MKTCPIFHYSRIIEKKITKVVKKKLTKQFVKDTKLPLFRMHQEQEARPYTEKFADDIKLFRTGEMKASCKEAPQWHLSGTEER